MTFREFLVNSTLHTAFKLARIRVEGKPEKTGCDLSVTNGAPASAVHPDPRFSGSYRPSHFYLARAQTGIFKGSNQEEAFSRPIRGGEAL